MIILEIVRRFTFESLIYLAKELREIVADGLEEYAEKLEEVERMVELINEEGEGEFFDKLAYAYDPRKHARLFSDKIVKLLEVLYTVRPRTISELARTLDRDVANVYRDLKYLEELGLVILIKNKRETKPIAIVDNYGLRIQLP